MVIQWMPQQEMRYMSGLLFRLETHTYTCTKNVLKLLLPIGTSFCCLTLTWKYSHAFILAKNLLKILLPIGTSIFSLTLTKSVYDIGLCSHAFILAKNLLKIMLPIGTSICSLTLTKKVSTTSAYFLLLQVRHIPSLLLRQALYP